MAQLDHKNIPRDTRFVSEAIINFYAAHVNSHLYPYEHPLVSDSLRNSFQCLQKAFQKQSIIKIDTNGRGLAVQGHSLQGDLPVFKSFAVWLNRCHIGSLSFVEGITRRELISFHKIISMKTLSSDELLKAMTEKSVTNVTVREYIPGRSESSEPALPERTDAVELIDGYMSTMFASPSTGETAEEGGAGTVALRNMDGEPLVKDYIGTRFDAVELEEAAAAADSVSGSSAARVADEEEYERCVTNLLERRLSTDEQQKVLSITPVKMAHLLNAMLFSSPDEDMISRISEAYFGASGEEKGKEDVRRCAVFYKGLKPSLRPAFHYLLTRFNIEEIAEQEEESPVASASHEAAPYEAPSPQAATVEEEILAPYSPWVVRKSEHADYIFDFIAGGQAIIHDFQLSPATASLFHGEHLEQLRDSATFERLSDDLAAAHEVRAPSTAALIDECSDDRVMLSVLAVMLELIESDLLEGEIYQRMSAKLSQLVEACADKGEFYKVLDVYTTLRTHSLQGKSGNYATGIIRNIFASDHFNARLIDALRTHGRKYRNTAEKLTRALRWFLVPYLLDALSEEEDTSKRRFMITLLTSARGEVIPHILKRLRDSRWYVLRNMLLLIRECHGRAHAEEIRDFLDHSVPLVQLEALRTLLSFQDKHGEPAVLKFLESDDEQLRKGAAWLAGAHRVKSSVSRLVRVLNEKDLRGKKFHIKKTIIRSLGRIADASVVGHLHRLCTSPKLVHRDDYDRMRIEVFKSLHNYPLTAVKPLVDYGMISGNREIVEISTKLLQRHEASVERRRDKNGS